MNSYFQPLLSPRSPLLRGVACAAAILAVTCVAAQEKLDLRFQLPRSAALHTLNSGTDGVTHAVSLEGRSGLPFDSRMTSVVQHTRGSFYRTHLLPELQRQAWRIAPYEVTYVQLTEGALSDTVFYDQWKDATARSCRRGVKRAMQNYLLESTTALDRFSRTVRATGGKLGGLHRGSEMDVRLGVSAWLPEIGLNYSSGPANLRFDVRLDVSVSLEFRHYRSAHTRFSAGYDAKDNMIRNRQKPELAADVNEAAEILVTTHPNSSRYLAGQTGSGAGSEHGSGAGGPHTLSRTEALDPGKYRAAKEQAVKAGESVAIQPR